MFQFPGFAFVPYVFRNKYLLVISAISNAYAAARAAIQHSKLQRSKVGFPIRKFTDQSLFAAPHDLSQRTTSFFASQRQGIHRILLRHLIALIINAHPLGAAARSLFDARSEKLRRLYPEPSNCSITHELSEKYRTFGSCLKTSLLQTHPGAKRSSSPTTGCLTLNNIGLCRVKRDNADIGQSQPDAFPLYDVR